MKTRAALAVCLAGLLAACVFSSDEAFFTRADAVTPFADGAHFAWREPGNGEARTIVFRRTGAGYELRELGRPDEKAMAVVFAAIAATPEEDYIAQITLPNADSARVYAFIWARGGGFWILASPRALTHLAEGPPALAEQCEQRPYGECALRGRVNMLALYERLIYPAFVTGGLTPNDYMEMIPVSAGN